MKKRNPNANCSNCPYSDRKTEPWLCARFPPSTVFVGRVDMVKLSAPRVDATGLCGEHPEFFLEAPLMPPETPLEEDY